MTAPSLTIPMAFSNSTYRMECTQPLGVKAAVESVTTTGRCTKAHSGIDTCAETIAAYSRYADYLMNQQSTLWMQACCCKPWLPLHQILNDVMNFLQEQHAPHSSMCRLKGGRTSGVNVDSGTSMQKNPSDTQWVANLRMPK